MVKVKCPSCNNEFDCVEDICNCPKCGAIFPISFQQSIQQPPAQEQFQSSFYVIYAIVNNKQQEVEKIAENGPELVLGRAKLYQYALRDPDSISRVHLRIKTNGGKIFVRDDSSTNGTYIDGQDIRNKGDIEVILGKEIDLVNPQSPVVKLIINKP